MVSTNMIHLAAENGEPIYDNMLHAPVSAHGLTVAYHRKPVLWDVEYASPEGALCAIIGPNGAGKSTFIKAALGLVPKVAGTVRFFGKPLSALRQRIAYVPQRTSVDWEFPANVRDVVLMGLYRHIGLLRRIRGEHHEKAIACLEQVGMADFSERQIGQLSGGQQQRVFLARALAQDADLYIMDEPFAGVDAATERSIINVLRELVEAGKTVICVHHDLETVTEYFSHVFLLNGQAVAAGKTADVFTEKNLQIAYGGRLAATQMAALR